MDNLEAELALKIRMMDEAERLKTFTNWPFDDKKKCNVNKVAEAGFYSIGTKKEPDWVKCFFCEKSLDGWEETDDPWEEHISHASYCDFAKLRKPFFQLTGHEYLALMNGLLNRHFDHCDKQINELKTMIDGKIKAWQTKSAEWKSINK